MPLIAMNDDVGNDDRLRLFAPRQYPLGLSDVPAFGESELKDIWSSYLSTNPSLVNSSYGARIQAALDDGDVRTAQKIMAASNIISISPSKKNSPLEPETAAFADQISKWISSPTKSTSVSTLKTASAASTTSLTDSLQATLNKALGPLSFDSLTSGGAERAYAPTAATQSPFVMRGVPAGAKQSAAPQQAGSQIDQFFKSLQNFVAGVAPAVKGIKRGKTKTVIQNDPDYTTYAVIGGAVIVSVVLAIAVGKSSRRKD